MSNEYYAPSGWPGTGSAGLSSGARSEMALIEDGFDKLPSLSGNGGLFVMVNSGGTALEAVTNVVAPGTIDMNGNNIILSADQGETIGAGTDGRIDFGVEGATALQLGVGGSKSQYLNFDPPAHAAQASTNFHRVLFGVSAATTIPTGTTNIASNHALFAPTFTLTGALNNSANLYISNAPSTGTRKYSIFVDAGDFRTDGNLFVGKVATDDGATAGVELQSDGFTTIARDGDAPLLINRLTSDGQLIVFQRDGSEVGDITVTSGAVTLTGSHLSRWSQLPNLAPRRHIERGTVMTAVDELCEWWIDEWEEVRVLEHEHSKVVDHRGRPAMTRAIEEIVRHRRLADPHRPNPRGVVTPEPNDHLVRSKPSETPGDRAVIGIFDRWDDGGRPDDDPWEFDFYLACTGDFPVRVKGPCTKEDLLESAGDGTARVQADGVMRDSTIAKVALSFPNAGTHEVNLVPCQLCVH